MHGSCLSKHLNWNKESIEGREVWDIMCAWGTLCVLLFSHLLCLFMPLCWCVVPHVTVCICACIVCGMYSSELASLVFGVCVWMHVCECEETIERRPTESTAFLKVPEWVCHRERKLKEKGDCGERETFPRHPESVRAIKSHGWSESWETEPEHARGA